MYEAVISNAYSRARPDTVLLDDSTVVFHPPEASALPAWRREYESFPSELVASLVEQSSVRKPVSKLPLPPATRIIPSRELRALFSKGGGGWQEFYRRYPAQRSWIELSPIAFSRDGTEAVVYREVHCGDLCGSGDLLWLERAEAGWRVRKSINFWIS